MNGLSGLGLTPLARGAVGFTVDGEIVLHDAPDRVAALLDRRFRLPNPKWMSARRLGFDPGQEPEWVEASVTMPDRTVHVPRGAIAIAKQTLAEDGWTLRLDTDRRSAGEPLSFALTVPSLRDYQEASRQAVLTRLQGLVILPCASGKAQPLDAKVLTSTGWKLMGDLLPGDEICDSLGGAQRVIRVFEQGVLPIYRVEFDDGGSVECCDDHLWLTSSMHERSGRSAILASVRSLHDIRTNLRNKAGVQYAIPYTAPVHFEDKPLPLDPWLMGAYLGDGCGRMGSITFDNSEEDVLTKFERFLPDSDTVTRRSKRGSKCITLTVRRKLREARPSELLSQLVTLKLRHLGSHEKFIPDIYKFASVSSRIALLQGLCDTDGHVQKNGGYVEYSTSSARLRDDICFLVQSLGGRVSWTAKQPYFNGRNGKKAGRISYRMNLVFRKSTIVPVSSVKHLARWCPKNRFSARYIVKVSAAGQKPCRCISVSSPNQLYITDDFAVTHNTRIGLSLVATLDVHTLIVVPTTDVARQWIVGLQTLIGVPAEAIGLVGDGQYQVDRPIVVAVIDSALRALMDLGVPRWRFGLVIVDECHRAPPRAVFRLLRHLPAKYRAGLTATPDHDLAPLIEWGFGPRLIETATRTLIERGILARPLIDLVGTGWRWSTAETVTTRKLTALHAALATDLLRTSFIADRVARDVAAGHTTLVLADRKELVQLFCDLLTARGVAATGLTSHVGKTKRAKVIDAFKSQSLRCLVATSLADEALDVPALTRLHLAWPQKARGKTAQKLGRLLRRWEGPDKRLIDYVDGEVPMLARRAQDRKRIYRESGLL